MPLRESTSSLKEPGSLDRLLGLAVSVELHHGVGESGTGEHDACINDGLGGVLVGLVGILALNEV